jgi:hypothetical protein
MLTLVARVGLCETSGDGALLPTSCWCAVEDGIVTHSKIEVKPSISGLYVRTAVHENVCTPEGKGPLGKFHDLKKYW